jgi:hypothetical protein
MVSIMEEGHTGWHSVAYFEIQPFEILSDIARETYCLESMRPKDALTYVSISQSADRGKLIPHDSL